MSATSSVSSGKEFRRRSSKASTTVPPRFIRPALRSQGTAADNRPKVAGAIAAEANDNTVSVAVNTAVTGWPAPASLPAAAGPARPQAPQPRPQAGGLTRGHWNPNRR